MTHARATSALVAVALLSAAPTTNAAEKPHFRLPIDCRPWVECYVQNYVDRNPSPRYDDYRCGPLTYDGHNGTDIRIQSIEMMERGVRVLAAAPGTVIRVRDGMPDVHYKLFGRAIINDRALGNAVIVDHGNGWTTIYAHMRRGSIRVRQGDKVKAGDPLGLVGMSGLTEFPHVHFEVRHFGNVIDPFAGRTKKTGCKATGEPLWKQDVLALLPYRRSFVIAAGFSTQALTREALLYGLDTKQAISRNSRNLMFFVDFAGLYPGDSYELRILAPDGKSVFRKSGKFAKRSAVHLIGGGKTNRTAPWPRGVYRGEFRLFREGGPRAKTYISVTREIELR